ncbi:hypothetical protein [Mycolicibacterium palauense]|uniref:hypothetical protein n=1 Tax=Mycolicibacterium palauense TaxID=2034511 RepID=UPI000BFEE8CF|nr:hypothetical protein [Mycolicibacterium palauense]
MVDRYFVWLGAGLVAGGVSAAMLAGAGVAAADSDGGGADSSSKGPAAGARSSAGGGSSDADSGPGARRHRVGSASTVSGRSVGRDSTATAGRGGKHRADDADASGDSRKGSRAGRHSRDDDEAGSGTGRHARGGDDTDDTDETTGRHARGDTDRTPGRHARDVEASGDDDATKAGDTPSAGRDDTEKSETTGGGSVDSPADAEDAGEVGEVGEVGDAGETTDSTDSTDTEVAHAPGGQHSEAAPGAGDAQKPRHAADAQETQDTPDAEGTGDAEDTATTGGAATTGDAEEDTQEDAGEAVVTAAAVVSEVPDAVSEVGSEVVSEADAAPAGEQDGEQEDGQATVANAVASEKAKAAPPKFSNLDEFGTYLYNLYVSAVQSIAGPARVPAGSKVSVVSSELTLDIGGGLVVPADWYFPTSSQEPTGLIYLQHGFLATATFYSATAAHLAEKTNSIVVAPTLSWNIFDSDGAAIMLHPMHQAVAELFTGDRSALTESAREAGFAGALPERVVLVGHSAGGGLVVGAARYMTENGSIDDLAGVVMLDGVGYLDYLETDLAALPSTVPVYNLAARPYTWNEYGAANATLDEVRPDSFDGVWMVGGLHSDTMQSASEDIQLAAYLLTGFSKPQNVDTALNVTTGWVNDLFSGTRSQGVYGKPGASFALVNGSTVAFGSLVSSLVNPDSEQLDGLPLGEFCSASAIQSAGTSRRNCPPPVAGAAAIETGWVPGRAGSLARTTWSTANSISSMRLSA